MDFYERGSGDRLVDEANYPEEILRFLAEEAALLEACVAGRDALVEVGCMSGRSARWAMDRALSYVGVDPVARYIDEATAWARREGWAESRCGFVCGGAERIDAILHELGFSGPSSKPPLLFFPFNSIGNMADLDAVLKSVARAGAPALVSTYEVSEPATAARQAYYSRCGYAGLASVSDARGVAFRSPDGLDTWAYRPGYFLARAQQAGLQVSPRTFGGIGIAYCVGCP